MSSKLVVRATRWLLVCVALTMCHSDQLAGPRLAPSKAEPLEESDIGRPVLASVAPTPQPTAPPPTATPIPTAAPTKAPAPAKAAPPSSAPPSGGTATAGSGPPGVGTGGNGGTGGTGGVGVPGSGSGGTGVVTSASSDSIPIRVASGKPSEDGAQLVVGSVQGVMRKKPDAPSKAVAPVAAIRDDIGRLLSLTGRVTFRRSEELVWQEGATGLPLYPFDAIRTHQSSTARIELINGSIIELAANSLVILNPSGLDISKRRDRATVRAGQLKTETKSELWILTSAALLKLKPKGKSKPGLATIAVNEGGKMRVELRAGLGSLLAKDLSNPSAPPKPIRLALKKAIVMEAPLVPEAFGWDEDPMWAQAEKHVEPLDAPRTPPEPPRERVVKSHNIDRIDRRSTSSVGGDIVITAPANYSEVEGEEIRVTGRVNTKEGELRINGIVVPIGAKLQFTEVVPLHVGANNIVIQFVREGNEPVFRRWTVIRKP